MTNDSAPSSIQAAGRAWQSWSEKKAAASGTLTQAEPVGVEVVVDAEGLASRTGAVPLGREGYFDALAATATQVTFSTTIQPP